MVPVSRCLQLLYTAAFWPFKLLAGTLKMVTLGHVRHDNKYWAHAPDWSSSCLDLTLLGTLDAGVFALCCAAAIRRLSETPCADRSQHVICAYSLLVWSWIPLAMLQWRLMRLLWQSEICHDSHLPVILPAGGRWAPGEAEGADTGRHEAAAEQEEGQAGPTVSGQGGVSRTWSAAESRSQQSLLLLLQSPAGALACLGSGRAR